MLGGAPFLGGASLPGGGPAFGVPALTGGPVTPPALPSGVIPPSNGFKLPGPGAGQTPPLPFPGGGQLPGGFGAVTTPPIGLPVAGPGGNSTCTQQQQQLACALLKSANIKAADTHASGNADDAFASSNLKDVCEGRQARRSSYYCRRGYNSPGGSTCLSTDLLTFMTDLQTRGSIEIVEIAGACHSRTSRHYSGQAVDLKKDGREAEYLTKCQETGGWGKEDTTSIHCHYFDGPHPNWL